MWSVKVWPNTSLLEGGIGFGFWFCVNCTAEAYKTGPSAEP
jgi:hypothetical protein